MPIPWVVGRRTRGTLLAGALLIGASSLTAADLASTYSDGEFPASVAAPSPCPCLRERRPKHSSRRRAGAPRPGTGRSAIDPLAGEHPDAPGAATADDDSRKQ